jgi:hypothetical protein
MTFAHHRLQEYLAAEYLRETYQPENDPAAIDFCFRDIWYHDVVTALVAASLRPEPIIAHLFGSDNDSQTWQEDSSFIS